MGPGLGLKAGRGGSLGSGLCIGSSRRILGFLVQFGLAVQDCVQRFQQLLPSEKARSADLWQKSSTNMGHVQMHKVSQTSCP